MKTLSYLSLFVFLLSSISFAASHVPAAKDLPFLTYDLGFSSGSTNNVTYNEINLGLNMNFTEYVTWRNAAFKRFGSNIKETYGIDSTVRFKADFKSDEGNGLDFFIGPGIRLASEKQTAAIGEAGLGIKVGGIRIGGGAKYLRYIETQKDPLGNTTAPDEVMYFITLSGAGAL